MHSATIVLYDLQRIVAQADEARQFLCCQCELNNFPHFLYRSCFTTIAACTLHDSKSNDTQGCKKRGAGDRLPSTYEGHALRHTCFPSQLDSMRTTLNIADVTANITRNHFCAYLNQVVHVLYTHRRLTCFAVFLYQHRRA